MTNDLSITKNYDQLLQTIRQALQSGRTQAAQQVNALLVQTYWHIGQHTVEFEQGGKETAPRPLY